MSKSRQQQLFDQDDLPELPPLWEREDTADCLIAEVAVNRPVASCYYYLVPANLRNRIGPGYRVQVGFGRGNRTETAFCVALHQEVKTQHRLKSIQEVIDTEALLSEELISLSRWIADRYLCSLGQVLQSLVPAGVKRKAGTRELVFYLLAENLTEASATQAKLTLKQSAVLDVLKKSQQPMRGEELATLAGCGTGPIQLLHKKGLIKSVRLRTSQFESEFGEVNREPDLNLNQEQSVALQKIKQILESRTSSTLLLHGVTGSGKTEVYIQAIREVISYGRQAIVLVPEISLTPQTIRRFRARFESVAVLHSHLSDAERHWHWQHIASGQVQVVVGARSAVFAPVPHLGMIVIDEEHETSFKQDIVPRYHAREVARERARQEGVPLILGSATPTLETWRNVHDKKYELSTLSQRVEQLPLPPVVIIDVRNDPQISRGAALGRALTAAIQTTLQEQGQIILFLNLRGFSPALWCKACGTSMKCPHCDISLTWHRDRQLSLCHSCDYTAEVPRFCPSCQQAGIRFVGIGTQKLEQEVRARFPDATCLRMDSDSMRKPGSHDEALESFRRGEVQILLGTQMIAKGLDFPNVTLVGVVNADTMLHQPDFRATERTFQLISQVAGRTGRSPRGGRVLVQTTSPEEPAILFAAEHDYQQFAEYELSTREEMNVPPFQKLTRIILRGPIEQQVHDFSQEFASLLKMSIKELQLDITLLGPAPAPIAKLKKNYRYHFQLTANSLNEIQHLWRDVVDKIPHVPNVDFVIDMEPINMR